MEGITIFLIVMACIMCLAAGIALGWGISARPGTIEVYNIISGKRANASAKSIQKSESAKYSYVRRAIAFGIRKKRELIPHPYIVRCPTTGKPLAAFYPKEDFQKAVNSVIRVDDEEKQRAILKAAEYQSKFEREKNKTVHEVNKQVNHHLKMHYEHAATMFKQKINRPGSQNQGGGF